MSVAKVNKEKYLNALLFFLENCNNSYLGIMKLNKLFYYLDFISYRDTGQSVTGETYLHLPQGPFAKTLDKAILNEAENNGWIDRDVAQSKTYGERNTFTALKEADTSAFSEYETGLLAKICAEFKDWSTAQMVAQTHMEAPWVFSSANAELNYKDADDIDFFSDSAN